MLCGGWGCRGAKAELGPTHVCGEAQALDMRAFPQRDPPAVRANCFLRS
jgi:hypothetical protein